jgi:hypothetical protein
MGNDEITITLDGNYTFDDTVTLDPSEWDDSFTTSPSSIYSPTGNVSIEGELTVGGVDVMQSIKDMQRVLGVVSRDIEKEEKYAGLKRAAEAYERELAKIETFEALRDSK